MATRTQAAGGRKKRTTSGGPIPDEAQAKPGHEAVWQSLQAGLTAMPAEGESDFVTLLADWNDRYQPRSPAAQHLVANVVLELV